MDAGKCNSLTTQTTNRNLDTHCGLGDAALPRLFPREEEAIRRAATNEADAEAHIAKFLEQRGQELAQHDRIAAEIGPLSYQENFVISGATNKADAEARLEKHRRDVRRLDQIAPARRRLGGEEAIITRDCKSIAEVEGRLQEHRRRVGELKRIRNERRPGANPVFHGLCLSNNGYWVQVNSAKGESDPDGWLHANIDETRQWEREEDKKDDEKRKRRGAHMCWAYG